MVGHFSLGELSLGNFRLGSFAWGFSFVICRLDFFVWDPSLMNFRLGNRAPEAEGTGLLMLGEPLAGHWGNPAGPPAAPGL